MKREGKKNILFILENYPPHHGGVEILFENICTRLAKKGYNVRVLTHKLSGSKEYERTSGVEIYRVPCLENRYLFTFVGPLYAYKHTKWADIIHTTTYNAAPVAWLVGKLTRTPIIITVHETWVGNWRNYTDLPWWSCLLHEALERPIWWLSFNHYICVSKSTKDQLEGVIGKKKNISVVYNGFDYEHWNPQEHLARAKKLRKELGLEKKYVVLGYGRPGPSKGFRYLAQAFPKIQEKVKNAHLVLILSKDNMYKKEYERIKHILEDNKEVTFLSPVSYNELPSHVLIADCVVVPSLCEGFGYTAIESSNLNIPTVISRAGSLPEVVGSTYQYCIPKDPVSIATAVEKIYQGETVSTESKIDFSWTRCLDSLEKIYKQVLEGRGKK